MIATTTIYCNIACQIQPLFEQIIKLDCHGKSKSLHHGLNVARPVLGTGS